MENSEKKFTVFGHRWPNDDTVEADLCDLETGESVIKVRIPTELYFEKENSELVVLLAAMAEEVKQLDQSEVQE